MLSMLFIAVLAGAVLPLQAGLNNLLRQPVGGALAATLVNFVVGAIGVAAVLAATGERWPNPGRTQGVPWWSWLGGLCGAALVCASVVAVSRLGYVGLAACLIAGQLAASVLFDHFGLLGNAVREVNTGRFVGVVLLAAGVAFILRA